MSLAISLRVNELGKSARVRRPGARRGICNPLPYHLAMPPGHLALVDLTPEPHVTSTRQLYPEPHSCAKCGGLFQVALPRCYTGWVGRDLLLCVRCAAVALCYHSSSQVAAGTLPPTPQNRAALEEAVWKLLEPSEIACTEDDLAVTDWVLSLFSGEAEALDWVVEAVRRRQGAEGVQ